MAWLACASNCSVAAHWRVTSQTVTEETRWQRINYVWVLQIRKVTTTRDEHGSHTLAAAQAMQAAMNTVPARHWQSSGTYVETECRHVDGEEYQVSRVTVVKPAWA